MEPESKESEVNDAAATVTGEPSKKKQKVEEATDAEKEEMVSSAPTSTSSSATTSTASSTPLDGPSSEEEEEDDDDEDGDNEDSGGDELDGDDVGEESKKAKKEGVPEKKRQKRKSKNRNMRRNIKKLLKSDELETSTKEAQAEEEERLKRMQEVERRRKEYQMQQFNQQLRERQHDGRSLMSLATQLPQQKLQVPMPAPQPSVIEISSSDDDEAAAAKRPQVEGAAAKVDPGSDSDIQILSGDEATAADTRGGDDEDDPNNSGSHVDDSLNVPDIDGRVLVNVGHPESEDPVYVAPQLARTLKPHQVGGVRFLYDCVIESGERFRQSPGFGCILAHSMGLGKTIQVCTFSDVFLSSTEGRHILVIVPINTIQNWQAEFNLWLPEEASADKSPLAADGGEVRPRNFRVRLLNDSLRNLAQRFKVIEEWRRDGGVLLMGYELYRQLANKRQRKKKRTAAARRNNDPECIDIEEEDRAKDMLDEIYGALVDPGPDLVICDEGHRIKNSHASTSQALKSIRTRRRVVLTGYPLQNNLMEYWCMVDFVRPNFLGNKSEFSNMFERPITNGQCADSTPKDKRLMMHRAHVLTGLLKGFVQRRGHKVLQKALPPKYEHVFLLRLTPTQRRLYRRFISDLQEDGNVANPLKAYAVCCKIWNHPDVLHNFLKKKEASDDLDLFDVDDEFGLTPKGKSKKSSKRQQQQQQLALSEASASGFVHDGPGFNPFPDAGGRGGGGGRGEEISYDWAQRLMSEYVPGVLEHSAKFQVFFAILDETIRAGDRLLLFSQSLLTLNTIEEFLQTEMTLNDGSPWVNGVNYFRLDGSTPAMERERLINKFNRAKDPSEIPLFMVSTRAGSLGINLVGANRVVVLDASWNPCHDSQAVCRVYRYGQTKPCHIYRLVTDNTIERRIYDRQVNKQGMADRVVDEQNPDNHLMTKDLNALIGENETDPEGWPDADEVAKASAGAFAEDRVLQAVLKQCHALFTRLPFAHESLLVDRKDKRLTRAEKRLAENNYKLERSGRTPLSAPSSRFAAFGHPLSSPQVNGSFPSSGGGFPGYGFYSGGAVFNASQQPTSSSSPFGPPPPLTPYSGSAFSQTLFPPPSSRQEGAPRGTPPPALTELERLLESGPRILPRPNPVGNSAAETFSSQQRRTPPLPPPVSSEGPSTSAAMSVPLEATLPTALAGLGGGGGYNLPATLVRKGVAARELHVPKDMEIQTNSPGSGPIRLTKGDRVMLVKTPNGVFLKVDGKVVKIKLPKDLLKATPPPPPPPLHPAPAMQPQQPMFAAGAGANEEIVIDSSDEEAAVEDPLGGDLTPVEATNAAL